MSNWQYANQVPTERWRSAMTLPRELILDQVEHGYLLRSIPVMETEKLRVDQVRLEPGAVTDRKNVGPAIGDASPLYEIDLVFLCDPNEEEELEFGIILESEQHEKLIAAYNNRDNEVFIARGESGKIEFSEQFPGIHTAPCQVSDAGEIRFHAFIDLSSIELFVDRGKLVMTELCFPESGFDRIHLYASHESVRLKEGVIYSLKSVW
jgi:fructan beta-fructosidase